jgi:hypothetical protein
LDCWDLRLYLGHFFGELSGLHSRCFGSNHLGARSLFGPEGDYLLGTRREFVGADSYVRGLSGRELQIALELL